MITNQVVMGEVIDQVPIKSRLQKSIVELSPNLQIEKNGFFLEIKEYFPRK